MSEPVELAHSTVGTQAVGLTDAITDDAVMMINVFEVPAAESDQFLYRWKDNVGQMAQQPGFVRARMYRSLADDARFRFINVVHWNSGAALAEARTNPEWRAAVQRMMDDGLHVKANPMVYETALDVAPGDRPQR
jgi:heme-degrading monooxygenase HmoA